MNKKVSVEQQNLHWQADQQNNKPSLLLYLLYFMLYCLTKELMLYIINCLLSTGLKTGFNGNFFIWQCKGDYWIRALVQLEKYLCSFNWWFLCRKILWSKLLRTNLAMPEVSCGVTWSILMALRGILHSEFAVGKSPCRIADWAECVLFC